MKPLSSYSCLGEALEHTLMEHPESIGLIEVNREKLSAKLTYSQIYQKAVHVSKILQNKQFDEGHTCGMLMTNQSKWNISAIGVFFAGGVLVPLDYKLTALEQIRLIEHVGLHSLIIEYPLWARILKENNISALDNIHVFVTEVPEGKDIGFASRWDQDSANMPFQIKHRQQEDVANIVYSSGTFGRAKGCMLTHKNYLLQAEALCEMFVVNQEHTYFSFIPTNHAIDFMCGFFMPLISNSKTIHQRTLRPEFIAHTINTYKVTHMATVPMLLKNLETKLKTQFQALPVLKRLFLNTMIGLNKLLTRKRPNYNLSKKLLKPVHQKFGGSLEYIIVGGAFTDPAMAQFFYDLGFSLFIGYGLTEAGTVLTVNDLKPFRADTVGKALDITKVELRNINEAGIGEVWAKGPTVMKGYFKDPELTQETIKGGWLDTGDLGIFDQDHLILKGRKKNMVVTSGGKNIYPEDIEHQFQTIQAQEFCIFAGSYIWEQNEDYRDDLVLTVLPKENIDHATIMQEIQSQNKSLSDYKRVKHVVFVKEEFPKTATMKIKRPLLAKKIREAGNDILIKAI